MTSLGKHFDFEIHPLPPYDFKLTVKKPAGWSLFNQFENYERGTLWTATHIDGTLLGIRLSSKGTTARPKVVARVYSNERLTREQQERIRALLVKATGADQRLDEFYRFARKDRILRHVVDDLYGMHDTFSPTVFADAILAILLQMAPLKRSNEMMSSFILCYGGTAEFDGRSIRTWPTPRRVARLRKDELATRCKVGYRAKSMIELAKVFERGAFPTAERLEEMNPEEARAKLLELPGIGDYSADIISPHGGFPIDVWSAEVFGKLFFGKEPRNNRQAVERVKKEGLKRWGRWSWMAFFYVVQDLDSLSKKMGIKLRLS